MFPWLGLLALPAVVAAVPVVTLAVPVYVHHWLAVVLLGLVHPRADVASWIDHVDPTLLLSAPTAQMVERLVLVWEVMARRIAADPRPLSHRTPQTPTP